MFVIQLPLHCWLCQTVKNLVTYKSEHSLQTKKKTQVYVFPGLLNKNQHTQQMANAKQFFQFYHHLV
jgi:hypothetical protein